MKKISILRPLLILLFALLVIILFHSAFGTTDLSWEYVFFLTTFCIIIFGGLFVIAFFFGIKNWIRKIPFMQNVPFLNTYLILVISFFLFEWYFLHFRFVLFPYNGIVSNYMLIVSDSDENITTAIADIDNCSNTIIKKKLEGQINIVGKVMNYQLDSIDNKMLYKIEIVYYINGQEKQLQYAEILTDKYCNSIYFNNPCSGHEADIERIRTQVNTNEESLLKVLWRSKS